MATNIYNYDGTLLTTVQDGTLDSSHASIKFPGRGYLNYGEPVNENMLWIMQNFAATSPPSNAVQGQFWYDTSLGLMKCYSGSSWSVVGGVQTASTDPGPGLNTGAFWYDTTNNQLNVWSGSSWLLVGPLGSSNNTDPINPSIPAYSKLQAARINDGTTNHQVWLFIVGGTLLGILSKDAEFTPSPGITGFSTIKPGLNLNSTISNIGVAGDTTLFKSTQTNLPSIDNNFDLGSSSYRFGNIYATNFVGTTTATTNLAGGSTGSVPIQTAANTTLMLPIGAAGTILTSDGTTAAWTPGQAATTITVTDTTSTIGTYYPIFVSTPGSGASLLCDTSLLSYNPNSDTLTVSNLSGTATKATNIVGGSAGSLVYQSGTDSTTTLPVGTSGKVLQSTGSGIQWADVGMPTGSVIPYAGPIAPSGWVMCDGSTYDGTTATYSALWSVIINYYGGTGQADFRVPDLRGRVPAGVDTSGLRLGSGVTGGITGAATLGVVGGEQTHTLDSTEMPAHNHGITDPGHTHGGVGYSSQGVQGSTTATMMAPYDSTVNSSTTDITINNAGGGGGHNNVQPTLVLNYIIKL